MTAEVEQRWYSTADAARYLGCSVDTIERHVKDGTLTARKLGGLVRIDVREIDAVMEGKRRRRRAS